MGVARGPYSALCCAFLGTQRGRGLLLSSSLLLMLLVVVVLVVAVHRAFMWALTPRLPYLPERLQRELSALLPTTFKVKIVAPEGVGRVYGVSLSVLASQTREAVLSDFAGAARACVCHCRAPPSHGLEVQSCRR